MPNKFSQYAPFFAQRILGAALILFALNRIFGLIPLPKHEGFAEHFLQTLEASHYLMPLIILIQLVSGFAFLTNRYVGLAAIILLPVTVNIFLFHLLHDRAAIIPALPLLGMNCSIIIAHLSSYKSLIQEGVQSV